MNCPCGNELCTGVEDGANHQCGGPREACGVQGCMECGRARGVIHTAGVRADNAERREAFLRQRVIELETMLRWYVENDDTNETAYNEPWLEKKREAMRLLGMNK